MDNIENAWSSFCLDENHYETNNNNDCDTNYDINNEDTDNGDIRKSTQCSCLNISTKTKISYLNSPIDLYDTFWKIPIIDYCKPSEGVIKKQMKFNSNSQEEVNDILNHKKNYSVVDDYIISQVYNTDGRNKFKDIRKISIGVYKKDIISYRSKQKSAFYNCFVVILRLLHNGIYKELHVKVFNTGKLEIPGIQDSSILNKTLLLLVNILSPLIKKTDNIPLTFLNDRTETVMINSNFNCGYYINRENMYKLLKYKYKINSNFDPCSYPGIQCEFYYDITKKLDEQNGIYQQHNDKNNKKKKKILNNNIVKVSFMVFRTGSVLIVGKCSEEILYNIYNFLCNIFTIEKQQIISSNINIKPISERNEVVKKVHKKIIYVETN